MTALALGVYVLGTAHFFPRLLVEKAWTVRSSRLAMLVWFSVICSTILALAASALAAEVALLPGDWSLLDVIRACTGSGGRRTDIAESIVAPTLASSVLVLVIVRVCLASRATLCRSRSERAQQGAALSLVAPGGARAGFLVLDHPDPAAFCLAGRRPAVVVTSGALDRLTDAQLLGVLAHEHAHLQGRHHLVLAVTETLRIALPWMGVFDLAHAQLRQILEMRADDVASRTCGRLDLARALLTMADSGTPRGALAAAGCATSQRVRRLAEPAAPRARALASSAAGGAVLATAWTVLFVTGCVVAAVAVHVDGATALI